MYPTIKFASVKPGRVATSPCQKNIYHVKFSPILIEPQVLPQPCTLLFSGVICGEYNHRQPFIALNPGLSDEGGALIAAGHSKSTIPLFLQRLSFLVTSSLRVCLDDDS